MTAKIHINEAALRGFNEQLYVGKEVVGAARPFKAARVGGGLTSITFERQDDGSLSAFVGMGIIVDLLTGVDGEHTLMGLKEGFNWDGAPTLTELALLNELVRIIPG